MGEDADANVFKGLTRERTALETKLYELQLALVQEAAVVHEQSEKRATGELISQG